MTAEEIRPRIVELKDAKQLDFEEISNLLNVEGLTTVTGKSWTKYNVSYVYYGRKEKKVLKSKTKVEPPSSKSTSKEVLSRIAALAKEHGHRWNDVAKALRKEGLKTVTGVAWNADLVSQLFRKRIREQPGRRRKGVPVDKESARISGEIVRMKKQAGMDFEEIASHLNAVKLKTFAGGRWNRDNVRKRYWSEWHRAHGTANKQPVKVTKPQIRGSSKAQREEDLMNEALKRSLAPNPDNVHGTISTFLRTMHAAGIRITKIVWLPTGEVEVERMVSDSFAIDI